MTLDLDLGEREIAAALEPFVIARAASDDPAWISMLVANARHQRRRRLTRRLVGWLPPLRRRQANLAVDYSRQWASHSVERELATGGATVACRWGDRGLRLRVAALRRVHLLHMMRVIERLGPARVLEVGCGNAVNLFVLAARFPDVHFAGVELSAGGVAAAAVMRAWPELPPTVVTFSPEPVRDMKPFERVRIVQGSAAALPFRAGAFDLVITRLALEQMEEIRTSALAEIRRVARRHVAMLEPFREWNDDGPARDYIVANDYFTGAIADLEALGLRPILATVDIPSKITFRAGLVVCGVA